MRTQVGQLLLKLIKVLPIVRFNCIFFLGCNDSAHIACQLGVVLNRHLESKKMDHHPKRDRNE